MNLCWGNTALVTSILKTLCMLGKHFTTYLYPLGFVHARQTLQHLVHARQTLQTLTCTPSMVLLILLRTDKYRVAFQEIRFVEVWNCGYNMNVNFASLCFHHWYFHLGFQRWGSAAATCISALFLFSLFLVCWVVSSLCHVI